MFGIVLSKHHFEEKSSKAGTTAQEITRDLSGAIESARQGLEHLVSPLDDVIAANPIDSLSRAVDIANQCVGEQFVSIRRELQRAYWQLELVFDTCNEAHLETAKKALDEAFLLVSNVERSSLLTSSSKDSSTNSTGSTKSDFPSLQKLLKKKFSAPSKTNLPLMRVSPVSPVCTVVATSSVFIINGKDAVSDLEEPGKQFSKVLYTNQGYPCSKTALRGPEEDEQEQNMAIYEKIRAQELTKKEELNARLEGLKYPHLMIDSYFNG